LHSLPVNVFARRVSRDGNVPAGNPQDRRPTPHQWHPGVFYNREMKHSAEFIRKALHLVAVRSRSKRYFCILCSIKGFTRYDRVPRPSPVARSPEQPRAFRLSARRKAIAFKQAETFRLAQAVELLVGHNRNASAPTFLGVSRISADAIGNSERRAADFRPRARQA